MKKRINLTQKYLLFQKMDGRRNSMLPKIKWSPPSHLFKKQKKADGKQPIGIPEVISPPLGNQEYTQSLWRLYKACTKDFIIRKSTAAAGSYYQDPRHR